MVAVASAVRSEGAPLEGAGAQANARTPASNTSRKPLTRDRLWGAVLARVVSVLERFGPFDEKGECRLRRYGPVLDALGHDEELSLAEINRRTLRELDTEGALPAQKELVLVVLVPGELTVKLCEPHDGVVRSHEVDRRPRAGDRSSGLAQIDDLAYFAYSTARVSRMTVTLI